MNTYSLTRDPLPAGHLAAYGFEPEVIACWVNSGVVQLMPLQVDAVMRTGLLRGSNVLALAPTSAGKTFVGEMAAVRHWQAGRKAVFLCPTRALVAEQFRHLESRYAPLGIRVAMATADYTRHDAAIRRGDYDFAVMVYEKLRAFLVSCPDMIFSMGVAVADELQILGDQERGETADLLLTRLTRAEPRVQVVGLSAVVENGDTLAAWLDAELLMSTVRPAELREGIYCREHNAFHYRTAAQREWTDELLPADIRDRQTAAGNDGDGDCSAGIVELCTALALAGENCLLFVPTRALSRQLCIAVASEMGVQADEVSSPMWDELRLAEDSLVRRQLLECMPAGVAFHNSELTAELRSMVEKSFEAGSIRVLVATPTLAQGVNLRAKNVIQIPIMLRGHGSGNTQRAAQAPLSVSRYRNQAGRAGRLGAGEPFGRSILIAGSHLEAARLSRAYVQAQPESVSRAFTDHSMDHFVLECVHSGLADSYSGIHAALAHTFAWHSGAVTADRALEDRLGECIRGLLDLQLIDESGGHRLRLTGSGQAMAAGGFRAETIREMMSFCSAWRTRTPADFEILCLCAFTADGEAFALSATAAEMKSNLWLRAARERMDRGGELRSDELRRLMEPAGGLALAGHGALKMAVIAGEWVSKKSTAEVEEQFRVVAGTVAALAAHLAWLVGGLASCAAAAQCPEEVGNAIRRLAGRLPQGLTQRAARLSQLQVSGLSRTFLNRLAADGYDSMAALKAAGEHDLKNLLPDFLRQRLSERLKDHNDKRASTKDDEMRLSNAPPSSIKCETQEPPAGAADEPNTENLANAVSRRVDRYDLILNSADPGCVIFYGRRLRLPPKPYALLCLLAERCGNTVTYLSIDEIVWPGEKVEPQQISAHKSTLTRELGKAATKELADTAIVTDPRYGLRMNLKLERVCIKPQARTGTSGPFVSSQIQPESQRI